MKDARTRQLGGTQAALNRAQQRERELRAQIDKLKSLNGELCLEVNGKDALLRDWARYHAMKVVDRDSAHAKGNLYGDIDARMRAYGLEAE